MEEHERKTDMRTKTAARLEQAERDTISRILLSTILSFLLAWAIGRPYSPTIAVTANLCLYIERGYQGGIRYGVRRVTVQVIQGSLVLLVMGIIRYIMHLPIPDPLLILLASCVALLIGLPINYRKPYSPLVCTLGNATFIIACAAIRDLSAFPWRVLECFGGFFIAQAVKGAVTIWKKRFGPFMHGFIPHFCTLLPRERRCHKSRQRP